MTTTTLNFTGWGSGVIAPLWALSSIGSSFQMRDRDQGHTVWGSEARWNIQMDKNTVIGDMQTVYTTGSGSDIIIVHFNWGLNVAINTGSDQYWIWRETLFNTPTVGWAIGYKRTGTSNEINFTIGTFTKSGGVFALKSTGATAFPTSTENYLALVMDYSVGTPTAELFVNDTIEISTSDAGVDCGNGAGVPIWNGPGGKDEHNFRSQYGDYITIEDTVDDTSRITADDGEVSYYQPVADITGATDFTVEPTYNGKTYVTLASQNRSSGQGIQPDSDVARTGWTTQIGGTTSLFQTINESLQPSLPHTGYIYHDGTYIRSSVPVSSSDSLEVSLTNPTSPPATGDLIIAFLVRKEGTGGSPQLKVELLDAATPRGSLTANVTDIFTQWSYKAFKVEASTISDFNDLRLKFTCPTGGSGTSAFSIEIAHVWMTSGVGGYGDYIYSTTDGHKFMCAIADLEKEDGGGASPVPTAVLFQMLGKPQSSSSRIIACTDGVETEFAFDIDAGIDNDSPVCHSLMTKLFVTTPEGDPWTESLFNDLKVGWTNKITPTDGLHILEMGVEVYGTNIGRPTATTSESTSDEAGCAAPPATGFVPRVMIY